jgi:hypothetical protein
MKATSALLLVLLPVLAMAGSAKDIVFGQRLADTRSRLELTDEQVEQITPVLQDAFRTQAGILEKYGVDLENRGQSSPRMGPRQLRSMAQELKAVRADTRQHLQGMLTEAQMEEYDRIQEERRSALREQIRARRGQG